MFILNSEQYFHFKTFAFRLQASVVNVFFGGGTDGGRDSVDAIQGPALNHATVQGWTLCDDTTTLSLIFG